MNPDHGFPRLTENCTAASASNSASTSTSASAAAAAADTPTGTAIALSDQRSFVHFSYIDEGCIFTEKSEASFITKLLKYQTCGNE